MGEVRVLSPQPMTGIPSLASSFFFASDTVDGRPGGRENRRRRRISSWASRYRVQKSPLFPPMIAKWRGGGFRKGEEVFSLLLRSLPSSSTHDVAGARNRFREMSG